MNIVILIVLLVAILFLLILAVLRVGKKGTDSSWKITVQNKLNELSYQSNSKDLVVQRSLIIELDKLLDFTIKQRGLSGESMGDRLKRAHSYFERNFYNEIWVAHKVRNRLAHEIDYRPTRKVLEHSAMTLRKAIKSLT